MNTRHGETMRRGGGYTDLSRRGYISEESKFDGIRDEVTNRFNDLRTTITIQGTLITNLNTQVGNLPTFAGQSGGSRQPKIAEPPKFSGADKKSTDLQDWIAQLGV